MRSSLVLLEPTYLKARWEDEAGMVGKDRIMRGLVGHG